MDLLKEKLIFCHSLWTSNGKINKNFIKKEPSLYSEVLLKTRFLNTESLLGERIYCVVNDIIDPMTCKCCDNLVVYENYTDGYRIYCSCKCRANDSDIRNITRKTNLEKYGVEYPAQSILVQEKMQETMLELYGAKHAFLCPDLKNKKDNTMMERYGVKNSMQSAELRANAEATNMLKRGVLNVSQDPSVREKAEQTMMDRFGYRSAIQSPIIIEKIRKTNLEKYGVEYPAQSILVQEKMQETMLELYGVKNISQLNISPKTIARLEDKDWCITQHVVNQKTLTQIAAELTDVTSGTVGCYFKKHAIDVSHFNGQSYVESLLVQYIESKYCTTIIENNRTLLKPKEIDIYLPEYKLAIEFNGIYWHHPDRYDGYDNWMNYHQYKIDECNKQGIKLLHLWENYGDHHLLIDNAIIDNNINNELEQVFKEIYTT